VFLGRGFLVRGVVRVETYGGAKGERAIEARKGKHGLGIAKKFVKSCS
jgi:hypothetical protein